MSISGVFVLCLSYLKDMIFFFFTNCERDFGRQSGVNNNSYKFT
jgi:hypothetical protein